MKLTPLNINQLLVLDNIDFLSFHHSKEEGFQIFLHEIRNGECKFTSLTPNEDYPEGEWVKLDIPLIPWIKNQQEIAGETFYQVKYETNSIQTQPSTSAS